jgi:D-alanyl-lipoteichoic acid acyltransferase DltB (MBOAT superfamily)
MDIALKAGRKSQVRSLIFTIVVNLFILGFFKYYGFIVTNLNAILPFYIPYRKLELPIGISFYTFQTLSYIIDVYRGNVDVQVNLIDFGTYVTMFPQLIAGPIVQYADVERQLRERKESLTMENPVVTIEMENGGIITAELYPDVAPQSVYNFISLANSVRRTSPAFATPIPKA